MAYIFTPACTYILCVNSELRAVRARGHTLTLLLCDIHLIICLTFELMLGVVGKSQTLSIANKIYSDSTTQISMETYIYLLV